MYFKTADVAGLRPFYREGGDPSKPTIVLLHGFPRGRTSSTTFSASGGSISCHRSSVKGTELATYVVEKGKPLVVPVQ